MSDEEWRPRPHWVRENRLARVLGTSRLQRGAMSGRGWLWLASCHSVPSKRRKYLSLYQNEELVT